MIFAACLLLLTETFPAIITNPGFERGLEDWGTVGHRGYRAGVDASVSTRPRRHWLSAGWAARYRPPDNAEYRVFTFVDATRYRGRLVRLSATILAHGEGVSLDAVTEGRSVRHALRPSEDWGRQTMMLRVPRDADTIQIGFHLRGGGSLDADDVRLEVLR